MTRQLRLIVGILLALALTACSALPKDPDKTLEKIDADKVVHVGVSHAPPYTDILGEEPTGTEVELITAWAEEHDARVEWTKGGEEQLVAQLEESHLDLVIGGITKDSPWQEKAAVTRPWGEDMDDSGVTHEHIVLAPLGENALVSDLEKFFDARKDKK